MKPVSNFFSSPVAGGIVLIIASAAAIIVANSPLREGYETLLKNPIGLTRKVIKPVSNFFSSPVAGGIVLIIASAAAIIVANSPLREGYETLLK
ncbi:Na+/H+ antiporter NhaA, partial [Klebsiella pneumoniae]